MLCVCVLSTVCMYTVYISQNVPYASLVSCEFALVITEMYFVTAGAAKAEAGLQFAGRL